MSKRNFILLIIILALVVIGVFWFLHSRQPVSVAGNTGGTNFFSQFNPFGNTPTPPKPPTTTPVNVSGLEPGTTTPAPEVKLHRVSSMPIAGFAVFQKERLKAVSVVADTAAPVPQTTQPAKSTKTKPTPPATEFVPAVRYVARATGNIYETFADVLQEQKFSSTVIPKVYDAYFGNNGQSVAMRYLKADAKTIETFVGNLPKEVLGQVLDGTNQVTGTFLPDNVTTISISPDTSKIFYVFNVQGNNYENTAIGTTLNFADSKKVQIFSSPFTEWLSAWGNANMITLTTKPAGTIPGYMYGLNPTTKSLGEVLGNINGLTTLPSPDGKLILYADNNLSLSVYNTTTTNSTLLGIKTLPEKCVWNNMSNAIYCAVPKSIPGAEYPDAWYQGEVSFSDQIWKVDMATGNATLIADPLTITGGEDIDGIKLALDTNENYLFFVNKKDSILWELELH